MDIIYEDIMTRKKFRLLFIGQFVYPVGGKEMGDVIKGEGCLVDRYFSPLQVSLY